MPFNVFPTISTSLPPTAGVQAFFIILPLFTTVTWFPITEATVVNACDAQPCQNGASCRERPIPQSIYYESRNQLPYECDCPFGWEGANCTVNVDDCKGDPCENGGRCEDRPNAQFVCHCRDGFIGQKCEYRDPCLDSPCRNDGRCDSSPLGTYQCICPRWYEGQDCEKAKLPCEATNSQCRHGTCETLYEVFQTRVNNQPKTASRISGFQCICDPGWMGVFCDREFNVCQHHQCQNGGICVPLGNHYECRCPSEDFEGLLCEHPTSSNPKPSDSPLDSHCEALGCTNQSGKNGTCSGQCIQAGCFDQDILNACNVWIDCLEATKFEFLAGERSCVERYRDGICDRQCAVPSCFNDGFDCADGGSTCPSMELCAAVYGDKICQPECDLPACGFDGGDCLQNPVPPPIDNVRTGYIALVLNADKNSYAKMERSLLAELAEVLRAVVRPAIDAITQQPVVVDMDGGLKVRITLMVDLWPDSSQADKRENFESIDQAVNTLKAALDSKSLDIPVPVAQLWVASDPYAQPPGEFTPGPRGGLPFLRSKDAIGLYIVLCVLSGAVIVLLVFIVIQRRPWKQARKRVHTHGIWSPPSFFFPSSAGAGPGAGGQARPGALASGTLVQQGPKTPPKSTASQLEDLLHPGGKRPRYTPPQPTEDYHQEEARGLLPQEGTQHCHTLLPSIQPRSHHQTDAAAAALTTEITNTIRGSDGLHQLSSDALSKLEVAIRGTRHSQVVAQPYAHPHYLKRSFSNIDASEFDQSTYGANCGRLMGLSAEKLQHQDALVTTRNPLSGETILHIAARMNVGARAIRRLCGTLVTDDECLPSAENTLALLCLDKDGRSPLAASAATDGLETTTALYRLEREAITCSRNATQSVVPATSTAEGSAANSTEKPTTESVRRRTRNVESRRSTPLMVSLKAGCTEVTKLLLDEGCSIQGVDETGRNLVHWAAVLNAAPLLSRISHTKGFVRMLEARDDCDRTPLMLAVRENSVEAAQILLEHQAVIDVFDFTDSSPMSEAKTRGFTHMLSLLMEYKLRRSSGTGGAGSSSRGNVTKERHGSESSATSTTSQGGAGSEIEATRGTTENATPSAQYATPHYPHPHISPPSDPSPTTSGTEQWHQKSFCSEVIKPDSSICSSSGGVLKIEDHISPQTSSTWSPPLMAPLSIKEVSPPATTTSYWPPPPPKPTQQLHHYHQQQGNYVDSCPYPNKVETHFPAAFPGNGYELPQQFYQKKYPDQQNPGYPLQHHQQQQQQQQQQQLPHVQQMTQNGLRSPRSGRVLSYLAGEQPPSRGMFVVQL